MTAGGYTPKARLPRDAALWNFDGLKEKKMVEEDPYASIRAVLRSIKENQSLKALQCDMLARLRLSGRFSDA
jgi:hypothetical protein